MNSFEDNNLKRIADALDRLIPSPINLKNLNSSNLFVWKTNPDQLIDLGYNEFYSPLELLKDYDVYKYKHRISSNFMKSRIDVSRKSHEYYFDDSKTYMRSLDVMITTKCSLKCANCCNLMQYYKVNHC